VKLKVLKYVRAEDYHICEDDKGTIHRVDLFVDGSLKGHDIDSIIGKMVDVDYLSPDGEIAHEVKETP